MTQLTEEQQERVKQLRDQSARRIPSNVPQWTDINFLLSLLDGDSQVAARPVGWQSATQRADPRVVTVTFETRECAEGFINGLEPAVGPVVAATAMRDKCVARVTAQAKALEHDRGNCAMSVRIALYEAIGALSSLTFDQVKPGEM